LAEKVYEVFVIELRETLTIVDGFAHNKHCGEGKFVVVDDFGEIAKNTTIDFLIRPREMIAG
jgi:hypothetical protein